MESFILNLFAKTAENTDDQKETPTETPATQEKVEENVNISEPPPSSDEIQKAVIVVPLENKAELSDASKESDDPILDVDKPKKDPDFVPSDSASDDDSTEEDKEDPRVLVANPPKEDDIEEAKTLACEKKIKKTKPKKMLLRILADENETDNAPRRSDRLKQAKMNIFLKYTKTRSQTKKAQNKTSSNSK
jgi:hypothetical protein